MTNRRPTSPRRIGWVVSWLVLTLVGTTIHRLAWVPPDRLDAGLSSISEFSAVKLVSNAFDLGVGPVWLVMALIVGDWGVYSLLQTVCAMGWAAAFALAIVHALLRLRRRLVFRLSTSAPQHPARRRFLIEAPTTLAALAVGGPAVLGAAIEPFDLRVRRYRIVINDLPSGLHGINAVLITDTHLGPRVPASFIESSIRRAIALRPDLFILGGDYVHSGSRYIRPAVAQLRLLVETGTPVVGVLGNHDWYNSNGLIASLMRDAGIRMLDNSRVFIDATTRSITDSPEGAGLCIAGVGDAQMDTVDLNAALSGVPDDTPRLLLSHNPDVAETPALRNDRIDLMLCGHTHGGQVCLPIVGPLYIPCRFGRKYAGGLVHGPACRVLTSRGVGMSICPVRLGVPPELVEVTLERAP